MTRRSSRPAESVTGADDEGLWKRWSALAWMTASGPLRAYRVRRAAQRGAVPIPALFYHRIADDRPTPWTLSNDEFAWQIDWLAERFEFVSLAEMQRRLQSKTSYRPAVAVTFDDGYQENLDAALPLLLKRRIPTTYFVTSGNVLSGEAFPHDRALGLHLPPHTVDEIAELSREGIEIGAHTRTHRDLGADLTRDELHDEIAGSLDDLAAMTQSSPTYFAFPFGQRSNIPAIAVDVVRQAGFAGYCRAYGGYNRPGEAACHLLRFHADPVRRRFRNWMTGDPRWDGVRADDPGLRR